MDTLRQWAVIAFALWLVITVEEHLETVLAITSTAAGYAPFVIFALVAGGGFVGMRRRRAAKLRTARERIMGGASADMGAVMRGSWVATQRWGGDDGLRMDHASVTYTPEFEHSSAAKRKKAEAEWRAHFPAAEWAITWNTAQHQMRTRRLPPLPTGKHWYTPSNEAPWFKLPIGPGRNGGQAVVDLMERPHVALSGATGSGKSSVLMGWVAHLLPFVARAEVRLIVCDPKMTDFAWLEWLGAAEYAGTYEEMTAKIAETVEVMRERIRAVRQRRTWDRTPIVLLIDELAELGRQAAASQIDPKSGKKRTGAGEPQVMRDLAALRALSRSVAIRVIVATQQPNVAAMGGSSQERDQHGHHVLCDTPSSEHWKMLGHVGVEPPALREPGHVLVLSGDEMTLAHGWWLPSPSAADVPKGEAARALAMLESLAEAVEVTEGPAAAESVRSEAPGGHLARVVELRTATSRARASRPKSNPLVKGTQRQAGTGE